MNILERSRNFLDKQVALHERSIMQAVVERVDIQLAEWKINELKELAGVFEAFDVKYKERLQTLIAKIKQEVQKIFDTALERIKLCMKGGY